MAATCVVCVVPQKHLSTQPSETRELPDMSNSCALLRHHLLQLSEPIANSLSQIDYRTPEGTNVSIKSLLQSLLPTSSSSENQITAEIRNFSLCCAALASSDSATWDFLNWVPKSLSIQALHAFRDLAKVYYQNLELKTDEFDSISDELRLVIELLPQVLPLLKDKIKESCVGDGDDNADIFAASARVPVDYAIVAAYQFRWFATQIEYPHLGKLCSLVIPCGLTALDHWSPEVKGQGMISFIHLVNNVNVVDISLYGDVLLDSCCHNIASSDEIWGYVVEMSVLLVTCTQRHNPRSLWFEKMLNEMLSHLERQPRNKERRIAWLELVDLLFNCLGLVLLAHFRRIFPLFFEWLHSDDDQTILLVLKLVQTVIRVTWVRNTPYIERLVDELAIIYKEAAMRRAREDIRTHICQILIMLQQCKGLQFEAAWKKHADDPNLSTVNLTSGGVDVAAIVGLLHLCRALQVTQVLCCVVALLCRAYQHFSSFCFCRVQYPWLFSEYSEESIEGIGISREVKSDWNKKQQPSGIQIPLMPFPRQAVKVIGVVAGLIEKIGKAVAVESQGSLSLPALGVTYTPTSTHTPEQIATTLKTLKIHRVRLPPETDPNTVRAFSFSNISLLLTLPNNLVPAVSSNRSAALWWLYRHFIPFYPRAHISAISVGTNILDSSSDLTEYILPAIRNVHLSLHDLGIHRISVSTTLSFINVMTTAFPPSSAEFQEPVGELLIKPLLQFLKETNSSFLIDLYPYKVYRMNSEIPIGFALFQEDQFTYRDDTVTGVRYRNLFDMMVDSVVTAMAVAGHENIPIAVMETGWPSGGGESEASEVYAELYLKGLVKHLNGGLGTPLRKEGVAETYIYELFDDVNRDSKIGKNWGILYPNLTRKYKIDFSGSERIVLNCGILMNLVFWVLLLAPFLLLQ
ncbi:Glycoside hydrolase family 17 [Dillenia turbinata]|uniref:Glycoside hydrolase family 17 n=1 Tax=Dillenia turbinata TaxID=194707 RepID=A0AAN8VGN3_9MAGN